MEAYRVLSHLTPLTVCTSKDVCHFHSFPRLSFPRLVTGAPLSLGSSSHFGTHGLVDSSSQLGTCGSVDSLKQYGTHFKIDSPYQIDTCLVYGSINHVTHPPLDDQTRDTLLSSFGTLVSSGSCYLMELILMGD